MEVRRAAEERCDQLCGWPKLARMPGTEKRINRRRLVAAIAGTVVAAAVAVGVVALTASDGSAQLAADKCQQLTSSQAIALPDGSKSSSWKAEFSAQFAPIGEGDFAIPVRITSPKGAVNSWEFLISEGVVHFQWEDTKGVDVGMATSKAAVVDQKWHKFSAEVSQSGPDIAVALSVDGQRVASTITGKKLDAAGSIVTIKPSDAGVDAGPVKDFTWTTGSTCAKL